MKTNTIRGAIRMVAGGLADLLLPRVCAACGANRIADEHLCEDCSRELLTLVSLPYCPRCGSTIGPNIPVREDGCSCCPPILPRFARVFRLGPYAGPLRSVIRELKYRRREEMRRRLGRLLGRAVAAAGLEPPLDMVMPVPMYWRRRLSRGYDHARVLACAVAAELHLPVGDELIRVRHTPPQTHLSKSKRIKNVQGAFQLNAAGTISGAHVLLVDDVSTTGATANEAAATLLAGGASRVILAVVAKSEPPTAYTDYWSRSG